MTIQVKQKYQENKYIKRHNNTYTNNSKKKMTAINLTTKSISMSLIKLFHINIGFCYTRRFRLIMTHILNLFSYIWRRYFTLLYNFRICYCANRIGIKRNNKRWRLWNIFLILFYFCYSLAFSVTIFCSGAAITIIVLLIRRSKSIGGELGGPTVPKYLTSAFLFFIWLMYLLLSTLEVYDVIKGF